MDLTCYLLDDYPVDIRPARNRREWMNRTPGSYAYRCLPLSIANAYGWEVRAPVTCEAEWNGGSTKGDIEVMFEDGANSPGSRRNTPFAESHFGSGILTFNVGVIIRTPPGYDLWVSGPANDFKDGIQALSAVIETSWMPFTFTMNWKFTRPHLNVRFEKGEPFCFFFPVEHGLVERFNPTLDQVGSDPDLERQYNLAYQQRALLIAFEQAKGDEVTIKGKDRFEGWYIKGEMPDGTGIADHKRRVQPKPFKTGASPSAPEGRRSRGTTS